MGSTWRRRSPGSVAGMQARSARWPPPKNAATRPMGWGNVNRALSLAQSELAAEGITQPTASQLKVALTGGTLVTADGGSVQLQGVLTLRSQGMGWGQIAHTLGVSPSGKVGGSPSVAGAHVPAPHVAVSAGGGRHIGHGAIVTAGGSLVGGDTAATIGRSGNGGSHSTQRIHTGLDGSAVAATASSHGAGANANVGMGMSGGNHFGNSNGAAGGAGRH